jgi:flagellum-specific ATP synthase
VDTVRSLLDGHIVLDRNLALHGHYPPISILESISRLMNSMASSQHLAKANAVRHLLAAYLKSEDLIRIGAYHNGTDPVLDNAIQALPAINKFLRQMPTEFSSFEAAIEKLQELPV